MKYIDKFEEGRFKNMEKGKLYILTGYNGISRMSLESLDSDTATILKGWSYIKETNWKYSEKEFPLVPDDSELSVDAKKLYQYAVKADDEIATKNALLSALFSSIIPGAGRFYAGRTGDGIFSFLTVAIPSIASYYYWSKDRERAALISLGFAAAFYLGDIYGSVTSIRKFNTVNKNNYIKKIEKELHIKEKYLE